MYYYLLDSDFKIIVGIDKFQSMIWNEKYDDIGDFELYIPATEDSVKLFTEAAERHYYICRKEDAKTNELTDLPIMMVESVKTDLSVKTGNFIIVTGSQIKKILYRRIALDEYAISGKIRDQLYSLVETNAVSPKDKDRCIPRLICDPDYHIPNEDDYLVNFAINGEFLSQIIAAACRVHKLGWDVVLDYNKGVLKFRITSGVDRSQSQKGDLSTWNEPVVFSIKNANLIKTTYSLDYENYRNVAVVKSKYEKYNETKNEIETLTDIVEVKPYKIDRRPVGLDRYEIFVDGEDYSLGSNGEAVNLAVMNAQSTSKGRSELTNYLKKIDVSCEVEVGVTFKYGIDYFLGDLVSFQNEFGQIFDARITGVLSTLAYNKVSVIPSFVIENYSGKEDDDIEKLDDSKLRWIVKPDGTADYRCSGDGTLRRIRSPIEFTGRITADGRERTCELGSRQVIKSEYFDDSKYSEYYQQ
jgi:hypothetical protein